MRDRTAIALLLGTLSDDHNHGKGATMPCQQHFTSHSDCLACTQTDILEREPYADRRDRERRGAAGAPAQGEWGAAWSDAGPGNSLSPSLLLSNHDGRVGLSAMLRRRPWRAITAATAVAALALTGCGEPSGGIGSRTASNPTSTARVNVINALLSDPTQVTGVQYHTPGGPADLITGTDRVVIQQVAQSQTITSTNSGSAMISTAPKGSQFLVAQIQVSPLGDAGELTGSGQTTLASIVVNGTTTNVTGMSNLFANNNSQPTTEALVLTVPRGASTQLSLSQSGLDQLISLPNGMRDPKDPAVFYRNDTSQVGKTYSLPFAHPAPPGFPTSSGFAYGAYPTTIAVLSASLTWFIIAGDYGVSAPIGQVPPNPGTAWLTLTVSVSGGNGWSGVVDPQNMVLSLPSGQEVPATVMRPNPSDPIFGGVVAWQVPAGFTNGTLTIAPGTLQPSGDPVPLQYNDATATIPISISPR